MGTDRQDAVSRGDVDEALDGLVHQFSDPLAFLRELVQNAIDAGTNDIAISCEFASDGDRGVTTIEVADSGCGMTRRIIERELTRLFASSKDGDHTKIGKFGIGFVSVFAIAPDAVCVDTSREGERWRVLFGRDRSYDLRTLAEPIEGTRVRVIKATTRAEHDDLKQRVPATVRRWCRHTRCEIRVDGVAINEPIDLPDAPCRVSVDDGVTTIVVGHARDRRPFHGFYNAGLTLYEADEHPRWLPRSGAQDDGPAVAAIACKASSPQLEHTLTRDKVIEDAAWRRVTSRIAGLVHTQLAELAGAMLSVALERPPTAELHEYLCDAVLWHLRHTRHGLDGVWGMDVFRSPSGAGISMRTCAGSHRGRQLLVTRVQTPLTDALEREDRTVVLVHGEAQLRLLRALVRPDIRILEAAQRWCLAAPPSGRFDDAGGPELTRAVGRLLRRCGGELSGVVLARVAETGAAGADLVAITQPSAECPTPIEAARTLGTWWLSRRRLLVLNEDHPLVVALVELAASKPGFAAYLLAKSFWLGARLDPRLDGDLARSALELSR